MLLLLLLLFMSYGSSAEAGNKNVCGFAIVVVVAPYDAEMQMTFFWNLLILK